MSQIVVLMYHSVYSSESEFNDILLEDRPYAIKSDIFERHVDFLLKKDYIILNPNDIESVLVDTELDNNYVLFTFDDGHEGFYKYAFPALKSRGLSAIFFITTDFIENRSGFCNWQQLSEMSDSGMSIQSHGVSHDFYENMNHAESESEFITSKNIIESKTNFTVDAISFPGGRYSSDSISIGKIHGFKYFFTSNEVINSIDNIVSTSCIGRFAIRCNTSESDLLDFIEASFFTKSKRNLINKIKKSAKFLLGNQLYHFFYKMANR